MRKAAIAILALLSPTLLFAQINPWDWPYLPHWGEISPVGVYTWQLPELTAKYENGEKTVISSRLRTHGESYDLYHLYRMRRITINKATLSLLHSPNTAHYGNNSGVIQRVTSRLDNVTLPSTTDVNQVLVPQSSSPTQDYIDIDITLLYRDILSNFPNSDGFVIKTNNTTSNNRLAFGGPYQSLKVYWDWNDCAPSYGQTVSQSATFSTFSPATAACRSDELNAMTWTINGQRNWGTIRSTLDFDFSSYSTSGFINITDARLYLYAHPNPVNGNLSSPESGQNTALLQRVISRWQCNTTNWNNQPIITTQNQVIIPTSTNAFQNYILDVTPALRDAIANQETILSFLFRQVNERTGSIRSDYRSMIFANGNHSNIFLRPALIICADWATRIGNTYTIEKRTDTIYQNSSKPPNYIPSIQAKNYDHHIIADSTKWSSMFSLNNESEDIKLSLTNNTISLILPGKSNDIFTVNIVNLEGKVLKTLKGFLIDRETININWMPRGMYFLVISNNKTLITKKFVKQ